jgi:hypothetical protein
MSRHLRPTAPQPLPEPGYTLLLQATADYVLALTGYDGLGLYAQVCGAAQHGAPCTVRHLTEAFPIDAQIVPRVCKTLVGAGVVAWVIEPDAEEGGGR